MRRLALTFTLFMAAACNPFDEEVILLPKEDVSFTIRGVDQFFYNQKTCQMAHNRTTNEFRVFDDKISNYFIVRCEEMPTSKGQQVKADVTWTSSRNIKRLKDLTFTVKKTDDSGKIWMWCEQKNIGIVIKNL